MIINWGNNGYIQTRVITWPSGIAVTAPPPSGTAPSNLAISRLSRTSNYITWTTSGTPDSVVLEYSTDNSSWTTVNLAGTATSYTHSGLPITLQTYYYRVKTITGGVSTDYSSTVSKLMTLVNFFGTVEPPMS